MQNPIYDYDSPTKLKLISTFESAKDAKKAESLFNSLLRIRAKDRNKYSNYSPKMLSLFLKTNFCVPQKDVELLDEIAAIKATGNIIECLVNEWMISPLLQALVHYRACVELFYPEDVPQKMKN